MQSNLESEADYNEKI